MKVSYCTCTDEEQVVGLSSERSYEGRAARHSDNLGCPALIFRIVETWLPARRRCAQ